MLPWRGRGNGASLKPNPNPNPDLNSNPKRRATRRAAAASSSRYCGRLGLGLELGFVHVETPHWTPPSTLTLTLTLTPLPPHVTAAGTEGPSKYVTAVARDAVLLPASCFLRVRVRLPASCSPLTTHDFILTFNVLASFYRAPTAAACTASRARRCGGRRQPYPLWRRCSSGRRRSRRQPTPCWPRTRPRGGRYAANACTIERGMRVPCHARAICVPCTCTCYMHMLHAHATSRCGGTQPTRAHAWPAHSTRMPCHLRAMHSHAHSVPCRAAVRALLNQYSVPTAYCLLPATYY